MDAPHEPLSTTSEWQQERAVETSNNSTNDFKIPTRVKCKVPLQITTSTVEEAGKGIFVTRDINEGELVFSIPRPLSSIVGTEMLSNTCDNCLMTAKNIAISKSLTSQPEFISCRKCEQIYYCTEKCQRAAWEHHHQYECETFKSSDLRNLWNRSSQNLPVRLRCVLRLLCLRACGKISEEWEELLSLQIITDNDPEVMAKRSAEAKCFTDQILRGFDFRIPREEILHLVWLIADNEQDIYAPEFKLFSSEEPWKFCSSRPLVTTRGIFMEPFISLINHACCPNVFYIFEGPEIQVRAIRNIGRGDEIYLSYIGDTLDTFVFRQKMLQIYWGFTCKCGLCQCGDLTPDRESPLSERVSNILKIQKFGRSDLADLEELIGEVQGMYYAQTELYRLQKLATDVYMELKLPKNALKHILTICLDTWSKVARWLRNLYRLLVIMDRVWEPRKRNKFRIMGTPENDMIYFHLRAIYVREVGKVFGKTSAIAMFEGNEFLKLIDHLNIRYVSGARRHVAERDWFLEAMYLLVEWAGLDANIAMPGIVALLQ